MALARERDDPAQQMNILREYVQACVLRSLHESEAFHGLSFVGGSALRFLYNLPRFSEDLDFSLEDEEGYEPVPWMEKVKRDMTLAGFDTTLKWNDRKTVHTAWIRVAGLLKELGIAAMEEQHLSIKLEIDTRPPAGGVIEIDLVNRHMIFSLRHHDLPSLMAGKVRALCTRPYPKGRDWYDLVWYKAKRPPVSPNLSLLQNALDQTQGKGVVDAHEWPILLRDRLNTINAESLREDVAPFLERPQDADLLLPDRLSTILRDASEQ